jgi:hypothetical protein
MRGLPRGCSPAGARRRVPPAQRVGALAIDVGVEDVAARVGQRDVAGDRTVEELQALLLRRAKVDAGREWRRRASPWRACRAWEEEGREGHDAYRRRR